MSRGVVDGAEPVIAHDEDAGSKASRQLHRVPFPGGGLEQAARTLHQDHVGLGPPLVGEEQWEDVSGVPVA